MDKLSKPAKGYQNRFRQQGMVLPEICHLQRNMPTEPHGRIRAGKRCASSWMERSALEDQLRAGPEWALS